MIYSYDTPGPVVTETRSQTSLNSLHQVPVLLGRDFARKAVLLCFKLNNVDSVVGFFGYYSLRSTE